MVTAVLLFSVFLCIVGMLGSASCGSRDKSNVE